MNSYQQFIHQSRYARWIKAKKRRETWEETVDRTIDFLIAHVKSMSIPEKDKDSIIKELG